MSQILPAYGILLRVFSPHSVTDADTYLPPPHSVPDTRRFCILFVFPHHSGQDTQRCCILFVFHPHSIPDTRAIVHYFVCFSLQRREYLALLYYICVSPYIVWDTRRYGILLCVSPPQRPGYSAAMVNYFVGPPPAASRFSALFYFICVSPYSVPVTRHCCILFVFLPTASRISVTVRFYLCFSPTASRILGAMDTSVNPCNDFFEYACGTWNRENVIPDDRTAYNTFNKLRDELQVALKSEYRYSRRCKWPSKSRIPCP